VRETGAGLADPSADLAARATAALGSEGALARRLANFRPRRGQQRMAAAVAEALVHGQHLLVEAGTGIGKTFAYLVPALLSRKRVLISTATRALQDQLFRRDLPTVCAALGVNPHVALLKGRANYLCHHRFERALASGVRARQDGERLGQLDAWRRQSGSGDLAECRFIPEDWPLRARVTSTSDNCLGNRCPHMDGCFVAKARRQAQQARIVVVNHHLLLADSRLREDALGVLLPEPDMVIVDEAHAFGEVALEAFGTTLSSFQIAEFLRDLEEATDLAGAAAARRMLEEPIAALDGALQALRDSIAKLGKAKGIREDLLSHGETAKVVQTLEEALETIARALSAVAEAHLELARLSERAAELVHRLRRWRFGDDAPSEDGDALSPGGKESSCAWYEGSERGFRLSATPLSVAEPLRGWREALGVPWVFTSATLTVGGSFQHLAEAWGLEKPSTLTIESPFDYENHARLYVPRDFPEPVPHNRERHLEALVELALRLLETTDGGAFLLFTSQDAMDRAAETLRAAAERGSFRRTLLVQGEQPHHLLIDAFKRDGRAVLLGTASFWEGVDVPGHALSLVIIDKLPFPSPGDPIRQARAEALRARGREPFLELDLPEAVMALRQGAGRLIRSERDRGVLVVADCRLLKKRYGEVFLASLPPMRRVASEEEVLAFLRGMAWASR
jgi:ATP-dependent DNA helicase DinG